MVELTRDRGVQAALPYCKACSGGSGSSGARQPRQKGQQQQQQQQQLAAVSVAAAVSVVAATPSNRETSRANKCRKQHATRIVVADTVKDYRLLVPSLTTPADIVLEVG